MRATPAVPFQRVQLHRSEGGIHLFASLAATRLEKCLKRGRWDSAFASSLLVLISQVPTGTSSGPQEWSSLPRTVLMTSVCFGCTIRHAIAGLHGHQLRLHFWLECFEFSVLSVLRKNLAAIVGYDLDHHLGMT